MLTWSSELNAELGKQDAPSSSSASSPLRGSNSCRGASSAPVAVLIHAACRQPARQHEYCVHPFARASIWGQSLVGSMFKTLHSSGQLMAMRQFTAGQSRTSESCCLSSAGASASRRSSAAKAASRGAAGSAGALGTSRCAANWNASSCGTPRWRLRMAASSGEPGSRKFGPSSASDVPAGGSSRGTEARSEK